MALGARGATGPCAQSRVAKVFKRGADSVTVPPRLTVAKCAWDRQNRSCLVTKENALVSLNESISARVKIKDKF